MDSKIYIIALFLLFSISVKSQDLTVLYEKVNKAVVVVLTEQKEFIKSGSSTKSVTSSGLGSGFMISDTEIITAAHVVQIADNIKVKFIDGEEIPAKVISSYIHADVALLKLIWPKKNAKTVKLADSDKVKIGEKVFVVGAPFGLGHSLSSGYISGIMKDTNDKNPFTISEYFQTDAAINQGNSGGPMFNMNGDVIGVVSNILSQSGGFQGIGFAATSNISQKLLIDNKMIWTGTKIIPLTGKMANILNVPQESGLLVQQVVNTSPLGIIGLKGGDTEISIAGEQIIIGGDIILSINGLKFELNDDTLVKVAKMSSEQYEGKSFELKVLRDGKIITLGSRK